jgi:DNA-binding NarL/FixJ family response regulator
MTAASGIPSVRELIAEYASIEDRLRSAQARGHGGSAPPVNPELVRLTEREREVLALLRRHHQTQ